MESVAWQQARKHQNNNSSSKATYAFTKDSRFKSNKLILYFISHIDVTPSITFPPQLEKLQLLASVEAIKSKLLTLIPTLLPLLTTIPNRKPI